MSPLDELLSSTARIDDIAPAALHNGRKALESAMANLSKTWSAEAPPLRQPAWRPRRRRRGMLVAASMAAAAAVAASTVSVLSGHSDGGHAGGIPVVSAGGRWNARIRLTAFSLLRDAGKAAGEQPGGWPNAAYWTVTSLYERGGETYHREIWISHHGDGFLEDDGVFGSMTPTNLGPTVFNVGASKLTWDQLYALPTDPARLGTVLRSHIKSGPDAYGQLYSLVGDLLRESPAPPALREALYDVAASIPGVRVAGHYIDALGRTGTAVERGGETLVINPGNGQLLADIDGSPNTGLSCGYGCVTYGVAYTYVSEGPASGPPTGQ